MVKANVINEEFSSDNIPKSNWFKFEEIGNSIKGTLIERFIKAGEGEFPDQEVYVLNKCTVNDDVVDELETYNVGIKATNTFINGRLKGVKLGTRIGFKFEKEIPAQKKGMRPAKSITPYVFGVDPNYEAMVEENNINDLDISDAPF